MEPALLLCLWPQFPGVPSRSHCQAHSRSCPARPSGGQHQPGALRSLGRLLKEPSWSPQASSGRPTRTESLPSTAGTAAGEGPWGPGRRWHLLSPQGLPPPPPPPGPPTSVQGPWGVELEPDTRVGGSRLHPFSLAGGPTTLVFPVPKSLLGSPPHLPLPGRLVTESEGGVHFCPFPLCTPLGPWLLPNPQDKVCRGNGPFSYRTGPLEGRRPARGPPSGFGATPRG